MVTVEQLLNYLTDLPDSAALIPGDPPALPETVMSAEDVAALLLPYVTARRHYAAELAALRGLISRCREMPPSPIQMHIIAI